MKKMVEKGEIITLSDGIEYLCFYEVEENNIHYVYLVSTTKPVEVRFAKYSGNDNKDELTIIGDKEEKKYVFDLFQKHGMKFFDDNKDEQDKL